MSINARFASFRPRYTPFRQAGFGTAARRAAASRISSLRRFRAVTTGRFARGMPATRGFRPLGLRSTGERKVIDVASSTYQVNSTGSFTLLNACVQGSDYSNRIGRKIVVKSVYIRGLVYPEAATGSAPVIQCRMILLVDNQPNGSAPAVTDVLNTGTATSQLNLNNRDRFKIIRDQTFVLGPQTWVAGPLISVSGSPSVHDVNCFAKINLETIYNAGNAGTIADINSGALYMLWIGSTVAASPGDGNAQVSSRVRFVDP